MTESQVHYRITGGELSPGSRVELIAEYPHQLVPLGGIYLGTGEVLGAVGRPYLFFRDGHLNGKALGLFALEANVLLEVV